MGVVTRWRATWESELSLVDASVVAIILVSSVFVLELAFLWVRAARLPSTRWRAFWATIGTLGFFTVLLTNVGGLGASFAYGLTAVSALPLARIGWACTVLLVLVMLGLELYRLARVRKSEEHR
jgi:hypothetical protein